MAKMALLILMACALAPLAAAQAAPDAPADADLASAPPAWAQAADAIADGAADAGAATAAAAGAVGAGVAAGADLAVAAVSAIGRGIANAAAFVGDALASLASLAWRAAVAVADTIAGALVAALTALAALAGKLLAALGLGAKAGFELARDHPRETVIVAGSAAGLGALAWLAKRFGFLGFLPLYTRLAPGQILDNEARAAVFQHIKENPGAHPSSIAETLGLGWGTVVYHLARLESSKLVTVKHGAHRKCYFAVGGDLDAQEREAVAAMATDKARAIVDTVRATPGITQKDLAERMGMSQALASWHVKRLVGSGVLLARREGRANALRVAEHVPVLGAAPTPVTSVAA